LSSSHDGADCLESEISDEFTPSGGEFSANARRKSLVDLDIVVDIDGNGKFFDFLDTCFESLVVRRNDDGRVDVSFDEWLSSSHHFTGKDDNGSSTITDFFVLDSS